MLNRGGFTSMLSTIGLLIAAGIFGAPLRTAGVVDVLLAFVERIAKTSRSMSLGVLILHAVFSRLRVLIMCPIPLSAAW